MKRCWLSLILLVVPVLPAPAHFVWIAPELKDQARVVFSEDSKPDDSVPVTKIAQTQLFRRTVAAAEPLTLQKVKNLYLIPVPEKDTCTIGGTCVYGVRMPPKGQEGEPCLLVYHPRAVLGGDRKEVRKQLAAPWDKLTMDIVIETGKDRCLGRVLWRGKPAASEVIVQVPAKKRVKTETGADGTFSFPTSTAGGLVEIRAYHLEDRTGMHDGKRYKSEKHYATLTFTLPKGLAAAVTASYQEAAPVADAAATRLLKEARQARAVWQNFPGFTAELTANHNGTVTRGTLTVEPSGKIVLKGFDDPDVNMVVRRQLASLVAHRLPGLTEKETPCAFLHKQFEHPLGPTIRVLNDSMHSTYRIRDQQIMEVHRQMKDGERFTITMLKNNLTPEKKYLPAAYVVDTWKANALISSQAFHHSWKRIGPYDLPATLLICTQRGASSPKEAAATSADTWLLTISGHQLLKQE
jgi:hypothetical protein